MAEENNDFINEEISQEIDEQKYFFGDAIGDAFTIIKENMGFALMMLLIIWASASVANLIISTMEIKTFTLLITLPNMIIVTCVEIALVVLVYNKYKDDQEKLVLGDTIKSTIVPLLVTNIMIVIILLIAFIVLGLVVTGILGAILGYDIMTVLTIISIFAVTIYVAIRLAFITQAVVLQGLHYADAINHSMTMSKKRGFTIFGIIIFPQLVNLVPQYFLESFIENYPLAMSVGAGFFAALATTFSAVALTGLYLHIRKEKISTYSIKDEEPYGYISE
jgi:hypothetical protein